MTSLFNSCKIVALGAFLCAFSTTNATLVIDVDQAALQGYIGESVSVSPSFTVNSTVGVLTQTIVLDVPNSPAPTPPSSGGSGSGGGGGEKYDASNWILERKYDQLVAARELEREQNGYYTSAPDEPLLPNQDIELAPTYDGPSDSVSVETKDDSPTAEAPIESKTQPDTISTQPDKTPKDTVSVPLVPSVPAEDKPQESKIPSQDSSVYPQKQSEDAGFYGAFKLETTDEEKLSFTHPVYPQPSCQNPENKYNWVFVGIALFPWILIIALVLYGLKKRKELNEALDEIEALSEKNPPKKK